MPAGALTQQFQSSHGAVAWEAFGKGPPLVMLHGTPFSSFIWRTIADSLASKFTIHLFDLVGYGQSEKAETVHLGVQNEIFAELLTHWGLERPYVLAHDFGAATALRTHFLNGCDYAHLILFDGVVLRPWGSPFVAHVREHEAAFAGMPDYMHEALLPPYLQTAAFKPLSAEALNGFMAPWLGETGKAAFYRQIAQMDQSYTQEIEDKLGMLRCPVQLLWGEQDDWVPLEQAFILRSALDAPEVRVIPDAGHVVQEDNPAAIIDAVLDTLT